MTKHTPLPKKVEIVETAELRGVPPRYMVLVNGFQWGPFQTSTPDRSGAYDVTYATADEARRAYLFDTK